ncbi:hypothetical protein [Actinomadura flavalba]|uniref:hypothetical protein n=1 Tax=Actinomadura flavalba TaxID=1120938 RepID=UPI0012DCF824|nr:hypothetical protein [Actinomadura flavalba]
MVDASPHLLVVATEGGGEARVAMSEGTRVWDGGRGSFAALAPGRAVVVRHGMERPGADRVWVDITRVIGTITAVGRASVDVDQGPHREAVTVEIPPKAMTAVLVRHPRLEPGHLVDVICAVTPDGPRAVAPGTSQPGHRADASPQAPVDARVADVSHGSATWFDGPGFGAAYPALDGEGDAGGCADAPPGCVPLPLLSLGSVVTVGNECAKRTAEVTVVACGCVAARYCDRCVQCGTSPRGRLVELTPVAFAALGGELERGCFNAALRHDPGVRA